MPFYLLFVSREPDLPYTIYTFIYSFTTFISLAILYYWVVFIKEW